MSKTMKNLLMIFTVVCAFVFVIFSLELIVINRGSGAKDGSLSAADSPSPGSNGASKQPGATGGPDAGPGTSGNSPDPNEGSNPPGGSLGVTQDTNEPEGGVGSDSGNTTDNPDEPAGTRYNIELPDHKGEIVFRVVEYVNENKIFEYIKTGEESEEEIYKFDFLGAGTAALELRYVYFADGLEEGAKSYLENTFAVTNSVYKGESRIRASELSGLAVTGSRSGVDFEAWIYSFEDIGIKNAGVAFIVYHSNDIQRDNLYAILDTLRLVE